MSRDFFVDAIDIRRWLAGDADTAYAERLARDRDIGRAIDSSDPLERIRAWWQNVPGREDDPTSVGERLARLSNLAVLALLLLGLLFGVGIGSVAFAFDGSHPVNLLALLGVLVGLPLLLLVITLILLLPVRIPGGGAVREALAVINPGRWVSAWLNRVAGMDLYGGFAGSQTRFARWQLALFSQWLAVGYFLGVLMTGWGLVAVTDLAFGWSTTLELSSGLVHGLFSALAMPWQIWLPDAVPDLALVDASRFYRLDTGSVSSDHAQALGGWWPFVLMTILVWGLAPRLLLLCLAVWRRGLASRSMFLEDREVLALLDRLATPHVDFGLAEEQQAPATGEAAPAPPDGARSAAAVMLWNQPMAEDAARSWLRETFGVEGTPVSLGTWMNEAEQQSLLASCHDEARQQGSRLLVVTKGWEPPLLEFADFLGRARDAWGDQAVITVVPVNTAGMGVDETDRAVWAGFLARHAGPRVYVQQATDEAPEA